MTRQLILRASAPLLAGLLLLSPAWAADPNADFRAAKKSVQQALRSRDPQQRIAAVKQLEQYPLVESVKLLLQVGLKNPDEQVRKASLDVLLTYKSDPDICEFLLTTLRKQTGRKGDGENVFALFWVLVASELPEAQEGVFGFLDRATASPEGVRLGLAIADQLGNQADLPSLAALNKLTRSDAFARNFAFRRAVVQSMTRTRLPETIDSLLPLLAQVRGEVRADIVRCLTTVTGQTFDTDVGAWLAWWNNNRPTFQFPAAAGAVSPGVYLAAQGANNYYGLALYAQGLVFVLDTSHSMVGERLAAAKRELIKAVAGLPEDVMFGILVFNKNVSPWQKALVQATPDVKQNAARFIESLGTMPGTASYNALEAAFNYDAEAIYFLTDGQPFGGKIVSPPEIVAAITQINQTRRLSIYSIGVGVRGEGTIFETFLKTLAERNYGDFRRVDQ